MGRRMRRTTSVISTLALLALVAPVVPSAYADAPGVTAVSTVRASADGGDTGHGPYERVEHTGHYSQRFSASDSGPDGSASATATQNVSADATSVAASGSVEGTATSGATEDDASADGSSDLVLDWTPAVSGRWRVKMDVTSTADSPTACLTIEARVGYDAVWVDCEDQAHHSDYVQQFTAGETTTIGTSVFDRVERGHGRITWSITLIPLSSPPSSTKKPAITGKKRVGKVLTASVGKWRGHPSTFAYRWLRNGRAISRATNRTYKAKKADQNKKISVRVKASNASGSATAVSKGYQVKKKQPKRHKSKHKNRGKNKGKDKGRDKGHR